MHVRNGEVGLSHFASEPFYFVALVAEDHSLRHCERIVKIAQGFKFIVLLLNSDEKLLDSIQGQLVTLDQDLERIVHEFVCHV